MRDVNELIDRAAHDLRSSRDAGMAEFLSPRFPACVIYLGEQSALFHPCVAEALQDGWGGRASLIPCFTVASVDAVCVAAADPSAGGAPFADARTGAPVDVAGLQRTVQRMMGNTGSFESMTQCVLFFVVDTVGMDQAEFRAWYESVRDVTAMLKGLQLRTMLLALLNNSLGAANARQITAELSAIYEDPEVRSANRHAYDGVFVYGNLSKGRGFNKLYNEHSPEENGDWDVLGSVMVLANSAGDESRASESALFSGGQATAVTAAFKQVEKPRRDIVSVALRRVMEALNRQHARAAAQQPDRGAVERALGFSNGRSVFIDEYNQLIAGVEQELAGWERLLPKQHPDADVTAMPYAAANDETCGCLGAFVCANHLARLRRRMAGSEGASGLTARIEERLTGALTAPQLLTMRKGEWLDRIRALYGEGYSAGDVGQRPVRDAVAQMMRVVVAQSVREETLRVVGDLYDAAERTEAAFERLSQDVALDTSVTEEGTHFNLNGFYGSRAEAFLADEKRLTALFGAVEHVGNTFEQMLDVLRSKALIPLFDSEYGGKNAFKLGFMEEQVARMADGRAAEAAQLVVGSELVDDMSNYVGYSTLIPLADQTCEAYLIHGEMGGGGTASQQLHAYLQNLGKPSGTGRVFLTAGPQDCATSLWFYTLTMSHLNA